MTDIAASGPLSSSRVRALRMPVAAAVGAVAAAGWLRHTGGVDVLPGGLASCPLHASTGLWCPFCGGLRCVAAVSHGDLAAAASLNVAVLLLLPVLAGWWGLALRSAWHGEAEEVPRVTNRVWLWVGLALVLFTLWRNVPSWPLAAWLAP